MGQKKWIAWDIEGQRDLVKTSRKRCVHEAGRIRRSSGCNGVHRVLWRGLISRLLRVTCSSTAPAHRPRPLRAPGVGHTSREARVAGRAPRRGSGASMPQHPWAGGGFDADRGFAALVPAEQAACLARQGREEIPGVGGVVGVGVFAAEAEVQPGGVCAYVVQRERAGCLPEVRGRSGARAPSKNYASA
jgi:hypothetical protein